MKYGIDISHWNGDIDFSKVNADFVILKLSQATHKDVKFDEYYSNCKSPKGAYIYNKVKDLAQAKEEAEFAVRSLNGRKLEYGVWLDLEDASMRKLGKPLLEAIITTEADILTKAGYEVGIYCNRDWYLNVLNGERLAKTYKFWIARYPYNDNGTVKESLSPKNLNGCVMWQYSSKGRVPGIKGNVDLNVEYKDYIPSVDSVQKFSISTQKNLRISTNFKVLEFQCKDGTDTVYVDTDFVKNILQKIRDHFNSPVIINSAYRTESYNEKVGGAKNSYHTKGRAFDIRVKGHTAREVALYAKKLGVKGIILYSTFVHLDSRETVYYAINNGKNNTVTKTF